VIYQDEKLLDDVLDDLRQAQSAKERETKIGLELALTGPKVSLEESTKRRPLTAPERLDLLQRVLETRQLLALERPASRSDSRPFVTEICDAYRIYVPRGADAGFESPAFVIWLSESKAQAGLLCLLENAGDSRSEPTNYAPMSTFSVLQCLLHFTRGRPNVLATAVPSRPHPNPHAQVDEGHPASLVAEFHNVKEHVYDFCRRPLELLRQWGCLVTAPQAIQVLYKIREYGPEAGLNWQTVTTFGYPVWIREVA